ncbi:hypothetical protein PTT21_11090, partial [Streptococcus pneumoniae]
YKQGDNHYFRAKINAILLHADVIKENQVTFLLFLLCRQRRRSANFRRNSFSFGLKVRTLLAYELKGL